MVTAGLDIGSRSIELMLLNDDGVTVHFCKEETTFDYLGQTEKMLAGVTFDRILVTGYGRHIVSKALGVDHVTEIKAHAAGIYRLFPKVRTILDIGGQDTKAISLDDNGWVIRFEMNDRCATGTGRFLEVLARPTGCKPAGPV